MSAGSYSKASGAESAHVCTRCEDPLTACAITAAGYISFCAANASSLFGEAASHSAVFPPGTVVANTTGCSRTAVTSCNATISPPQPCEDFELLSDGSTELRMGRRDTAAGWLALEVSSAHLPGVIVEVEFLAQAEVIGYLRIGCEIAAGLHVNTSIVATDYIHVFPPDCGGIKKYSLGFTAGSPTTPQMPDSAYGCTVVRIWLETDPTRPALLVDAAEMGHRSGLRVYNFISHAIRVWAIMFMRAL